MSQRARSCLPLVLHAMFLFVSIHHLVKCNTPRQPSRPSVLTVRALSRGLVPVADESLPWVNRVAWITILIPVEQLCDFGQSNTHRNAPRAERCFKATHRCGQCCLGDALEPCHTVQLICGCARHKLSAGQPSGRWPAGITLLLAWT